MKYLLLAALLLQAPQAFSQTKKQASQGKKTIGELLKQADRGAGISFGEKRGISLPGGVVEPASRPRTKVDLNQVKPPRTSSFFEDASSDQAKLEKITDQQINELFKLTQKFRTSPQRGELWLRLAELYVEKAGVIDFRKQGEFDQKLRDFQEGRSKAKPTLDLRDAKEFNKKAIQLYEWFLRDFPKDEKTDQALFFLGYNNFEIGELKKGTQYYSRLTKEFPRSPYVVEANFALGEYYFENEKWADALKSYREVLKNRKHRLFTFSLYKAAWCEFRSGNTERALKTMELLVKSSKEATAQAAAGRKALNKNRLESEGLRDIVLFYAEVGNPEQAPAYFVNLAGNDSKNYLEKLAYYYGDKGNLLGARTVFNHLIKEDPTNPKAFDFKYQVVRLYSNARRSREFRDEMFAWIRDFGVGSSWYQANKGNTELVDSSVRLREATLRNYILQQHQTAQNSRAAFSQGLAVEGYRLYLGEFKSSASIADMHFYFGELLYDMKRYDDASAQYRWVVENGQGSKFQLQAAENIVIALEKDLPKDEQIATKVGKTLDPVAFDPKVSRFVETSLWYTNKFPSSEKNVEMQFRIGRLHYQHNQFDQAIPYFREIVQKHPRTKYAEYSANLLLDIYNLRKDYEGLAKAGNELLALPGISSSKAGGDIREVLEKASFKRAQDMEVSKDYAGSAVQFEAFSKQNPASPLATTAIFNAAINFERAGQNSQAIRSHEAVLASKDKPAESLKPKSRRILAKLKQDSGRLDEAAQLYRASAIESKNDPLAPNMYFNAAILFEALGRNKEAIQNYRSFFDLNKKSDRVEAIFQIATLHRKDGQWAAAVEKYEEYLQLGAKDQEKVVEASYWVYEGSRRLGRKKAAAEWQAKTLATQKRFAPNRKGPGALYAARIRMGQAREQFDELKKLRIPANPAEQQRAVQKKITFVTDLNAALSDVVKFDSPEEIVSALSVLGQVNVHMSEALIGAPLPSGLNEEQKKQYQEGVAKIADPFVQKGKESLRASIARASELDAYPQDYFQARTILSRLEPNSVYEHGEQSAEIKFGSWMGL
ncbi:MAG: tetratricopeptide repeat protein [Pseudobdellovibrionaceae bacterium]